MSEQKVPRSVKQRIVIKFLVGENVPSAEIHYRLQQQYGEECLRRRHSSPYCCLITMRCSTLRGTFCSLITLATPRQDWTGSNPSRRESGGCGLTLSRSHSCCEVRLVYTQISPGHIWTTLYTYLLLSYGKNGYAKAPQYYVMLTSPVFLFVHCVSRSNKFLITGLTFYTVCTVWAIVHFVYLFILTNLVYTSNSRRSVSKNISITH